MDVLNTKQVAEITSFSMQKVQQLIRAGKIPAVNTSAGNCKPRWLIRKCDLDRYLTPDNVPAAKAIVERTPRRSRIDAHIKDKVFN